LEGFEGIEWIEGLNGFEGFFMRNVVLLIYLSFCSPTTKILAYPW